MSIGQGSIGENAIGELPSAGLDLAVGGIGTLDLIANIPEVDAGALISVPVSAISLSVNTPSIQVGNILDVPTGQIILSSQVPQVMQSVNLLGATGTIHINALEPNLGTGAFVDNPSRQDTYTSTSGSIAFASIGEFGVGEGAPEVTASGRRTARLPLRSAGEILILAGKTLDVPSGSVTLIARVPETLARGRRLRTQAILS